jgi:NTE family protein
MNMAFLSSFKIGPDTVYPEALRQRLRSFPLFEDVSDASLRRLLSEANWFGLPGGMLLKRDGENSQAVFIVVSGSLGVFAEDEHGKRRFVAHIPAGETVGEMSMISGSTEHTAQLVAMRDSELLRVPPSAFDALISRHPRVMYSMMRVLVKRLQDTTRSPVDMVRPKTFAIIPLQPDLDHSPIANRLASALVNMGSKAAVLDASHAEQSGEWFANFEAVHDVVFYRGDAPDSAWTHHCLRQADRIFMIARVDQPLPSQALELPAFKERASGLPQLLLLHPTDRNQNIPEHFAVRSGLFESHHHVRAGKPDDIRRLARFIAGRAVGIVLAGGGARGFAHIGVVKALMEAGVPFDNIGGTSMGALIAAGLACEWTIEELTERMRDAFVNGNPLNDYTLPLIALVRGKKVSDLLQNNYGELRIEELPKPFFCVSSDLTTGRVHVHRAGMLWRALRASVALPGILPPVTYHGHLLVDGGLMNNLPVDIMAERASGPIIASDVTGEIDLKARDDKYGERPWWWLIGQRMAGTPSIVSILMRSGTVGSEVQRRLAREQANYMFEPPLAGVGLRDWRAFDRCIAEGYEHALRMIELHGVPLTEVWSEGPAVSIEHQVRAAAQ